MRNHYIPWSSGKDNYACQGHGDEYDSYLDAMSHTGAPPPYGEVLVSTVDLAARLTPVALPELSVAEQVFGGQMKRHQLSLEHLTTLMQERARLHDRHQQSLWLRHYHIQARLFGARLHGKSDSYKLATRLEGMVMQLDEQLRNEELGFWKDSMDLREKMTEVMQDYDALKHRASLVEEGPFEGGYHG